MKRITPEWFSKFKKEPGVYGILNIPDNIHYIGSSVNVYLRIGEQWLNLYHGILCNEKLMNDYARLGPDNFHFFVFEYCDRERLEEREDFYMYAVEESYNIQSAKIGIHRRYKKELEILQREMDYRT